MKNFTTFLIAFFLVLSQINGTLFAQTWVQGANIGGDARYAAVAFSIGTKGYFGTGWSSARLKDIWEYDSATNTWTQKADFPNGERHHAVGFSIGSKGYIGGGSDNPSGVRNDFWEYDPATNTWTPKANLPAGRMFATGFSANSKGYIGGGENSGAKTDFWEYNPVADTWTPKTNMPTSIAAGCAFSIGTKGYVGGGFYSANLYEYNTVTDTWTDKGALPYSSGATEAGASDGTYGYILGSDSYKTDFYQYNPTSNVWTPKTSVPVGLIWAIAFNIGTDIYYGSGNISTGGNTKSFYGTSIVLPVELINFQAKTVENTVLLTWQTASETNASHFDIERSNDGISFQKIGETKAQGKAANYQFTDDTPLSMSYYRLKGIDFDEKSTISKVVSISTKGNNKLKVYPSVSTGVLNIETTGTDANFQIINLLGQSVMGGKTKQTIDISALPKGTYLLKIGIEQVKFIKQ